jgi:hypothetical protein|nr:MAG TPA: hypothetical protein [Caudoviricetes sp.]
MTATNHTEHYELSQYTDNDHPTYTGDYNGDMAKIDAAIYEASQSGGLTAVAHTDDLTGDGSTGNPLGVADTIARTEDVPSLDGYATTESVTQAIASAIADRLTAGDIKAGSGINISTSGNTVTISYEGGGSTGGLMSVAHDNTLTGDGTTDAPLGVTVMETAEKEGYAAWLVKTASGLCVGIMPQSGLGFQSGGGFSRLIRVQTDGTTISPGTKGRLAAVGLPESVWRQIDKRIESKLTAARR